MPNTGLNGKFLNSVIDEVKELGAERFKFLVREMMASGYPPGSQPVDEHQEYLRLVELKLKGDPMYYRSAAAQQRLTELELMFGPSPAIPQMGAM